MLEPLGKTLAGLIEERFTSPLISSYVISWSIFNWKFWVVLFSNNTATKTFELVNSLYGSQASWIFIGFGVPAIITGAYLFFLPKPIRMVYSVWRKNQAEYDKIREIHDAEQKVPAKNLWEIRAQIDVLNARLDERSQDIQRSNAQLQDAVSRAAIAESEAEKQRTQNKALMDRYDELKRKSVLAEEFASAVSTATAADSMDQIDQQKDSPYLGIREKVVYGATDSGRAPIFISPPHSSLESAITRGKELNRRVLVVMYDATRAHKSNLEYQAGCFFEFIDTKRLVQENFVTCLTTTSDLRAGDFLNLDALMEEPYLLVIEPATAEVQWMNTLHANPNSGLEEIQAILRGGKREHKVKLKSEIRQQQDATRVTKVESAGDLKSST